MEPSSSTTSTSTVGLPRLSRISRPMMSTMAVMGASLENARERLALLLQQGMGAEKAAMIVTPPGELSNNEAAEINMSKTPGKSSKSKALQLGRAVEWPDSPDQIGRAHV